MTLTQQAQQAIALESITIPENLQWFELGGRKIFAIICTPTSLSSDSIAYLVQSIPHGAVDLGMGGLCEAAGGRWYGIRIHMSDSADRVKEKVIQAVRALNGNIGTAAV